MARPLVQWRHPILLIFVLLQSWGVRSDADWSMLSDGGRALFGPAPLSTYAANPELQAGPPSLVVVRALNVLPGIGGELAAHLLLAVLAWYLLFLAERWAVPQATWRSVPLRPGLMTLLIGVPVLQEWSALAGALPHVEDGLALLTFALTFRAVDRDRPYLAAVLAGLTAAWKPWAVVALPLLWGLPRSRQQRLRALLIAAAVPAVCWMPFVLGDHSTLSAVSIGFTLRGNSTLRVLGFSGLDVPNWWRSVELAGSFGVAAIAAIRRDWRVAFAAGCTARVLLDPAGFDYYVAGLVLATAVTERVSSVRPWRTLLLLVAMVYVNPLLTMHSQTLVRFCVLTLVTASWMYPWRVPDRLRPVHAGAADAIPMPRGALSGQRQQANGPARRGQMAAFSQLVPPKG
jgi:hypothetical protein